MLVLVFWCIESAPILNEIEGSVNELFMDPPGSPPLESSIQKSLSFPQPPRMYHIHIRARKTKRKRSYREGGYTEWPLTGTASPGQRIVPLGKSVSMPLSLAVFARRCCCCCCWTREALLFSSLFLALGGQRQPGWTSAQAAVLVLVELLLHLRSSAESRRAGERDRGTLNRRAISAVAMATLGAGAAPGHQSELTLYSDMRESNPRLSLYRSLFLSYSAENPTTKHPPQREYTTSPRALPQRDYPPSSSPPPPPACSLRFSLGRKS